MAKHEADASHMLVIRPPSADFAKTLEETEVQTSLAEHTSNNPVVRSPSAHFSKTPKETEAQTYGHGSNVHTGPVVMQFDSGRFVMFCNKASSDYNPSYCDYDEITKEIFQTDEV